MKRKSRFNLKSIFFIIGIIVLLLLGSKVYSKNKLKHYVLETYKDHIQVKKDQKKVGNLESDLAYNQKYIISKNIPDFGDSNLNKLVNSHIDGDIESFKADNAKLKKKNFDEIPFLGLDYKSVKYGENIASIVFYIDKLYAGKSQERKNIKSIVVDLKNKKEINLEDLIIDEAYDFFYKESKKQLGNKLSPESLEGLKDNHDLYKNFFIDENGLELIFNLEGENLKAKIDYKDLENYTKLDLISLEELPQELIDEKIEWANFKGPIRPGLDSDKPMVALTFDDGPYEATTEPIIDMLEEYDSTATFFILGEKVEANSELIKKAADQGNEIANHSLNHKLLTAISGSELDEQIDKTQELIESVIGYKPYLLRPTYGAVNRNMEENIDLPFILWSIDTLDWEHRNPDMTVAKVMNNVRDGDIILMHDIYPTTTEATLRLIPKLVEEGYQLVTISELYAYKGIELNSGQSYTDAN